MASCSRDQREGSAAQARASITWPLQQLPVQVAEAVVARLPRQAKQQLRLTCKAAQALVDATTQQLTIKLAEPFRGGVAARFPQLAALQLTGTGQLQSDQGVAQLMFRGGCAGVTSLTFHRVCAQAMAAVRGCPNVKQCSIGLAPGHARGGAEGALALVRNNCSQLPSLSSLTISHQLCDSELVALGSCPSLVHLDVQFGRVSAVGWAAFMALPVALLKAELYVDALPVDALVTWESGMSALTALTLVHWRTLLMEDNKICLPSSIRTLSLKHMRCWPSTPLPNLTP